MLPVAEEGGGWPGWCTYDASILGSPEVEIMCGGINSKIPKAAAVWRQGNFLHFGFEEHPGQLNENGRRILLNSIAYIARFTEDRPLVTTPSGFVQKHYPKPRRYLKSALRRPDTTSEKLSKYFAKALRPKIAEMNVADAKAWIEQHMGFLCAHPVSGSLTVDEDAKALGLALDDAVIFDRVKTIDDARLLPFLRRRFPQGPQKAGLEKWRSWLEQNRPYLFFDEQTGYVWLLDPLAKKRGIPSRKLRGPLRADRPVQVDK